MNFLEVILKTSITTVLEHFNYKNMAIWEPKNQLQLLVARFLPVSALKILAWEGAYIFHSEDAVQLL